MRPVAVYIAKTSNEGMSVSYNHRLTAFEALDRPTGFVKSGQNSQEAALLVRASLATGIEFESYEKNETVESWMAF